MDKQFHPILYNGCNYLSMLGLKLNHVSKRGRWCFRGWRPISRNSIIRSPGIPVNCLLSICLWCVIVMKHISAVMSSMKEIWKHLLLYVQLCYDSVFCGFVSIIRARSSLYCQFQNAFLFNFQYVPKMHVTSFKVWHSLIRFGLNHILAYKRRREITHKSVFAVIRYWIRRFIHILWAARIPLLS